MITFIDTVDGQLYWSLAAVPKASNCFDNRRLRNIAYNRSEVIVVTASLLHRKFHSRFFYINDSHKYGRVIYYLMN